MCAVVLIGLVLHRALLEPEDVRPPTEAMHLLRQRQENPEKKEKSEPFPRTSTTSWAIIRLAGKGRGESLGATKARLVGH